jgi:hypothetical protein
MLTAHNGDHSVRRLIVSQIPSEKGKVESKMTFQDKGSYSEGETSQGTVA